MTNNAKIHKDEVVTVFTEKWDAEKAKRIAAEKARVEGREEGREEGIEELSKLNSILVAAGRMEEMIKSFTDKALRQKLMQEYEAQLV